MLSWAPVSALSHNRAIVMTLHFSRPAAMPLMSAVLFTTAVLPVGSIAGGGGTGKTFNAQVRIKNITEANATGVSQESIPRVSIPTVMVGDPGNAAAETSEAPAVGSVASSFRIAANEVTVAQYTAFLNSVAAVRSRANRTVVDSLYNRASMGRPKNVSGISRQGKGTTASPFVYAPIGNGEHPMANVSWLNAARFANWLHNGATNGADTESGAYTLNGRSKEAAGITRNPDAKWWIPNEDEWFKAAYYKGGDASAGYHSFPTRSDLPPGNDNPAATNQANFRVLNQTFCVTQTNAFDRGQNYLTPVGFFTNSSSPYGTFDQAGNVQEWTETEILQRRSPARVLRGGTWRTNLETLRPRATARASSAANTAGFRLASAPTIGTPDGRLTGNVLMRAGHQLLSGRQARIAVGETVAISANAGSQFLIVAEAETIDPAAQGPQTNVPVTLSDTNRIFRFTVQVIGDSITVLPSSEPF